MKPFLVAAFVMMAGTAQAELSDLFEEWFSGRPHVPAVKHTRPMVYEVPALAFRGQHFTNSLGCDYSRAGAPGQVVWHLIVQTRRNGCPNRIVQKG